ncbi:MAG TPA: Stf0 family sulfotransferase [Anaerolineales bacterium]|nr:Stf0 family sulfotransferase [Anaerolineales bacterium]
MKPRLSYTIWFTQRTGSSLLCKVLEETGIAGKPNEWLWSWLEEHRSSSPRELQNQLWESGTTSNGIFGIKHSFHEPHFSKLIETLRQFPNCPSNENNRARIWEYAFPNHRHIFMTRRNKVRLAVSWWKAIQSQEWHRLTGAPAKSVDLSKAYSFDAIQHLYNECSMREAGIQEFFTEGKIAPLTIVYEDFIQEYERTVRKILEFLGLNAADIEISPPPLARTADDLSEGWAQRFREELQHGWVNRGW